MVREERVDATEDREAARGMGFEEQLNAARAGLSARWRELEDEARRAGAPPGWLRP